MTIIEALRLSKETGRSFARNGSKFVKWIPRITNGRWGAADDPSSKAGQ